MPQPYQSEQETAEAPPARSDRGESLAPSPTRKPAPAPVATVSTAPSKLVVDKFKLTAALNYPNLTLTLDTDLPPDAHIVVSVSRAYTKVDSTNRFPIDYAFIRSTAGELKKPTQVKLDHEAWKRDLEKAKADSSRLGFPIHVKAIERIIEVSATLPIGQSDPRFGSRNERLTGKAVIKHAGGGAGVTTEVRISAPTNVSASVTRRMPSLDPYDLDLNASYILADRVPVLPVPNPRDPMRALQRGVYAPTGSVIRIETIRSISDARWYRVTVSDGAGNRLANGWVNSSALFGQILRAR